MICTATQGAYGTRSLSFISLSNSFNKLLALKVQYQSDIIRCSMSGAYKINKRCIAYRPNDIFAIFPTNCQIVSLIELKWKLNDMSRSSWQDASIDNLKRIIFTLACISMMMGQLMILITIIDDFDHNERKCWAAYQCSQWPLEPWWSRGGEWGDIGLVRDKYLDVQLIFKHQYHILLLILDRRLWWMFLNCISRQNMLMTLRAEHYIDDLIDLYFKLCDTNMLHKKQIKSTKFIMKWPTGGKWESSIVN